MSDSTSRTKGTEAPAIAAIRAANASLLGQDRDPSKPFKREGYAAATNRGYSTAMGRGLELAVTLAIMVALGYGADHLFGTAPVFVILFSVLGFAGITVKLFLGYDLEMKKHEEGAIWNRKAGDAS
ncbi:MAG: AtpZ/AtpI family protein [Aquihabitans sp.]